ncbi:hypothetical protein TUZN_0829 [Thermoproteus uzoniensis 768-20]|uniref:Uncharacterized protein n=1 Tax=Thermoproteus uzoniensis (strain 768-20) TaxID=999630 RepID=F2L5E4_THEU7|nr:hypothetical protein [Thermoproteus uzoniensis]AEA12315.1 hypothetical protein TUZN_0829 [Thermoproteus uzoniensis 768-20]
MSAVVRARVGEVRMARGKLLEFYSSLDSSYRAVLDVRLARVLGKTFEEIALEKPDEIYQALSKAVGKHNADVFMIMYAKWLQRKAIGN